MFKQIWKQAQTHQVRLVLSVLGTSFIGTGLILCLRLVGILENLELQSYDQILKLRPQESMDERIVIIGIDDDDFLRMKRYPISDQALHNLLTKIQSYQPRVIGVDIFRDLPQEPGNQEFSALLQNSENIIAIESILGKPKSRVSPPPAIAPEQVGFVDVPLERGSTRRVFLGSFDHKKIFKSSFTVKMAEAYLKGEGIASANGVKNPDAMRFGSSEIPWFYKNSGGYINADDGGIQSLINFRNHPNPFRILSMEEIESQSIQPEWIQDKIVLVGIVAQSEKDFVTAAGVLGKPGGIITGIEFQAHAISQIVQSALLNRPLITTWSDPWETLWIIFWGGVGLTGLIWSRHPWQHYGQLVLLGGGLLLISYLLILQGVWVPILPPMLALIVNGVFIYTFYLYDMSLRQKLADRQQVIEQTFSNIHNGPLQTLGLVLRDPVLEKPETSYLHEQLIHLNKELRAVNEAVQKEVIEHPDRLILVDGTELDLQDSLPELLSDVFYETAKRPNLKLDRLKYINANIDTHDCARLKPEQRRGLCRFLEESLCNVGKHAKQVTHLNVFFRKEGTDWILRIEDDGVAHQTRNIEQVGGNGTQQALRLARDLGGNFQRSWRPKQGVVSQITWPDQPPSLLSKLKTRWRVKP